MCPSARWISLVLALFLGQPSVFAPDLQIQSVQVEPPDRMVVTYEGVGGTTYTLLRGSSVTNITTPVATNSGPAGVARLVDTAGVGAGERFYRIVATTSASLTTIRETSPVQGELGVAVQREAILRFTAPLAAGTVLTTNRFYATLGSRRVLSRIELSSDRTRATLFHLEPLPGSAVVSVMFDGSGLNDAEGNPLDADGDGVAGGTAVIRFETLNTTPLAGTAVIGTVFASELQAGDDTGAGAINRPLAGVTITVDGMEETVRTVTDAEGNFILDPAPPGRFFVHIDGRTVKDEGAGIRYPDRAYYPFVGKAWEAVAGRKDNLAGGTGRIYLPLIQPGTLQEVSATQATTITFPKEVVAANPALEGVKITVPANALFSDNGTRGGRVGIAPVPPDRLPGPLPAGLEFPLVITIQSDGAQNFDVPVPVRFPNLPDPMTGQALPPGAKTGLWSFDHKTGEWELQGTMTISADGKFAESDPGVGVRQPGWHGTNGACQMDDPFIAEPPKGPCDPTCPPRAGDWLSLSIDSELCLDTQGTNDLGEKLAGKASVEEITVDGSDGGPCIDGSGVAVPPPTTFLISRNICIYPSVEPCDDDQTNWSESNWPCYLERYQRQKAGAISPCREAVRIHEQHHLDVDFAGIYEPLLAQAAREIRGLSAPCNDPAAAAAMKAKIDAIMLDVNKKFLAAKQEFARNHNRRSPAAPYDGAYRAEDAYYDRLIAKLHATVQQNGWALPLTDCTLPEPQGPASSPRGQGQAGLHQTSAGRGALVSLTLDGPSTVSLAPGESMTIAATGSSDDGQTFAVPTGSLRFSASPAGIVSVTPAGVVTALKEGRAFLTASADGGGDIPFSDVMLVRVQTSPSPDGSGTPGVGGGTPGSGLTSASRLPGPAYFALYDPARGEVFHRGRADSNAGRVSVFLWARSAYQIYMFNPASGRVGQASFVTPGAGTRSRFPAALPYAAGTADHDGDGLNDEAEFIVGTDPRNPDSDRDGVPDGTEVRNGDDPLDGRPASTGLIQTLDTPGNALDVAAAGNVLAVADGSAGLLLFDVSAATKPRRLAQITANGSAVAVAAGGNHVLAALQGAGVGIIDTAGRAGPGLLRQVNLGAPVNGVAVAGSDGFAALANGRVARIDLASGEVRETLEIVGGGNLQDLVVSGQTLFVLAPGRLHAVALDGGVMELTGSVESPGSIGAGGRRLRLFVADGLAYATHTFGFNVMDVRDRTQLRLVAANNTTQAGWKQIVPTGSGLAFAAVGNNSTDDGPHDVALYDLGGIGGAASTQAGLRNQFVTSFETPGLARAVVVHGGVGYVADGTAGLEVVNFRPFDRGTVPPVVTMSASFSLAPGRAESGRRAHVTAHVRDDAEVRGVEFLLDGVVAGVDSSYPFEFHFRTPELTRTTTSFTLQARATDTGGNTTSTEVVVVRLVPDATPPMITGRSPAPGSFEREVQTVSAVFNEPLDGATVSGSTVIVRSAGPDLAFGGRDDVLVADGQVEYRSAARAVFLTFGQALAPGYYEARVRPPLADAVGNSIRAESAWKFWVVTEEDGDGDGLPDNIEAAMGYDQTRRDTNRNGVSDGDEDLDGDGLGNAWEIRFGYDPRVRDSNGNGVNDDQEDADNDALVNLREFRFGSSPLSVDSDGDGWDDNGEVADGTNPAEAASRPGAVVTSPAISFLNSVPERLPTNLRMPIQSAAVSYLNAVRETVPPGLPMPVTSLPVSYLNAVPESLPAGTALPFSSLPVSYLNAEPAGLPAGTPRILLSPVIQYRNE